MLFVFGLGFTLLAWLVLFMLLFPLVGVFHFTGPITFDVSPTVESPVFVNVITYVWQIHDNTGRRRWSVYVHNACLKPFIWFFVVILDAVTPPYPPIAKIMSITSVPELMHGVYMSRIYVRVLVVGLYLSPLHMQEMPLNPPMACTCPW
jgi:hypothetical protein